MNKNTDPELLLDFTSFITKFFPQFIFDENNKFLIKDMSLWANRDPKFNDKEPGWHLDRGIYLAGAPGVGKDVIFRLLRKYISYISSPYGFGHRVTWQYAKEFQKDKVGYSCFDQDKGNLYYEELALFDEGSNPLTCSRENVQHFGNKLLIGREIINIRYNMFVNYGWQTHFSSNANDTEVEALYGLRAVDRVNEMCNYMFLKGRSKRGRVAPQFVNNTNASAPPPPRETTIDEHKANKERLESEYQLFLAEGRVTNQVALNYHLLLSYNCAVPMDDEIRDLMEIAEQSYEAPAKQLMKTGRDEHKQAYTWAAARTMAVIKFYQGLVAGGAQSIFGIISVPVDGLVRNLVADNKQQQNG